MKRNKGLIKPIEQENLSSTASGVFDTFDVYQQKLVGEWPETPVGQVLFNVPGSSTFTAPVGVTSISIVLIGGGGGGRGANQYGGGGGGGGLCWVNEFPVMAGTTYNLNVGAGGIGGFDGTSNSGSNTWFFQAPGGALSVAATGGEGGKSNPNSQNAQGGYPLVGSDLLSSPFNLENGGGNGGLGGVHNQGGGGGGAGGYSGNGGNGQGWTNESGSTNQAQTAGQGGAGGGGGRTNQDLHGAGGGVNVFGQGENGAAANATVGNIASSGYGGSGGSRGHNPPQSYRPGVDFTGGDNTLTQHGGPFSTHTGNAGGTIDNVSFTINSIARSRTGRLIWHYVNGNGFRGDVQIDTVVLSGGATATFNFDSNADNFLTSPDSNVSFGTWSADPSTELGNLIAVNNGNTSTRGRWNRDASGTPSGGTGLSVVDNSFYLYAEVSGRNFRNFWLASPEFTIAANQSLTVSYKQARNGSNMGEIKSYYYEGANVAPPEVANGTYGGFYGGGGGGAESNGGEYRGGNGANGAIRIIFGPNRDFPNTNTIDLSN